MLENRKTHVVIPLWRYVRRGGVKVLLTLGNQLTTLGIQCEVIVVGHIPDDNLDICVDTVQLPVSRFVYAILAKAPRLAVIWDITALVLLFFYFSRTDATHVICNFHMQVYAARLAQIIFRRKYHLIYYIQAYEVDFYPKRTLYQAMRRWLARQTYRIRTEQLVNTMIYRALDYHITNDPEKCIVPGIDLEKFKPVPRAPRAELVVGTLYSPALEKGSRFALEAFDQPVINQAPLKFVIGTSYLNVPAPKYEIMRINDEDELVRFYQMLDILVAVPCKQYGAPHLPILEGMACGCAVICGNFYLATNMSNSIVVSSENSTEIANAIEFVANHPRVRKKIVEGGLASVKDLQWTAVAKRFCTAIGVEIDG